MLGWPLDAVYRVAFVDPPNVTIHDEGQAKNKTAYAARPGDHLPGKQGDAAAVDPLDRGSQHLGEGDEQANDTRSGR